jgi:hypothetical protein
MRQRGPPSESGPYPLCPARASGPQAFRCPRLARAARRQAYAAEMAARPLRALCSGGADSPGGRECWGLPVPGWPWEARPRGLATQAHPGMTRQDVWPTEPIGRVLPHPGRAFAPDIPHRPRRLWGDVPFGHHAQSSPLGPPARLGRVVWRCQAPIGWQRCRVGPRPPGGRFPQSVDAPGPVRGRLPHHALDVCLLRGEWLQHRGQRMGEAALREHVVLRMEQHDAPVVCMQINPPGEWPLLAPQSGDTVRVSSPLQPHWSA